MKKIIRICTVMALLGITSCTSSKEVMSVPSERIHKSYKLPACHKAIHETLLKNQSKLIIPAASLKLDKRKEDEI